MFAWVAGEYTGERLGLPWRRQRPTRAPRSAQEKDAAMTNDQLKERIVQTIRDLRSYGRNRPPNELTGYELSDLSHSPVRFNQGVPELVIRAELGIKACSPEQQEFDRAIGELLAEGILESVELRDWPRGQYERPDGAMVGMERSRLKAAKQRKDDDGLGWGLRVIVNGALIGDTIPAKPQDLRAFHLTPKGLAGLNGESGNARWTGAAERLPLERAET